VLHGLPGGFQQQAVLRIHGSGFCFIDPEEIGIEVGDVVMGAKLYADGVLKTSGAKTWNLVHNACNIGALVNATDFWKGNVDDVRVYNTALTAAQVTALQ